MVTIETMAYLIASKLAARATAQQPAEAVPAACYVDAHAPLLSEEPERVGASAGLKRRNASGHKQ